MLVIVQIVAAGQDAAHRVIPFDSQHRPAGPTNLSYVKLQTEPGIARLNSRSWTMKPWYWVSMGLTAGFVLYIVTLKLGLGWPVVVCMIAVSPPFLAGFLNARPGGDCRHAARPINFLAVFSPHRLARQRPPSIPDCGTPLASTSGAGHGRPSTLSRRDLLGRLSSAFCARNSPLPVCIDPGAGVLSQPLAPTPRGPADWPPEVGPLPSIGTFATPQNIP
jgi:hypothetical protein